MRMRTAYVGLGANLGDRGETMREALRRIAAHPRMRLAAVSAFYETPPWGKTDQPPFLNAAACIAFDMTPQELLDVLQEIEHALGRRVIDFLRDALGDAHDVGAVRVVRHMVDADEALRRQHTEHNVVQPQPVVQNPHRLFFERNRVPLRIRHRIARRLLGRFVPAAGGEYEEEHAEQEDASAEQSLHHLLLFHTLMALRAAHVYTRPRR